MIPSNYSQARSRFYSEIESNGQLNLVGPDIANNTAIEVKDTKALLSYFAAVHTRELVVTDQIDLRPMTTLIPDETLGYNEFIESTKVDDRLTYYFQATTFTHREPIMFYDYSLFGERSDYKPFDSSKTKPINTMMTADLATIRSFSHEHFKFKNYRGIVGFERVAKHKKGYTIYMPDKGLYLTIIASRFSNKQPTGTYLAILFTGD